MKKNPTPAPPCECGHPRHVHAKLSGRPAHCKGWNGAGPSGYPCRYCGRYTPIDGVTMHQWDDPNGRWWRVDCGHCEWESEALHDPRTVARIGREHLEDTHKDSRP